MVSGLADSSWLVLDETCWNLLGLIGPSYGKLWLTLATCG